VAGPGGGFLGALALGWSALACRAVLPFLIVPFAWWLGRESYISRRQPEVLHGTGSRNSASWYGRNHMAAAAWADTLFGGARFKYGHVIGQQNTGI